MNVAQSTNGGDTGGIDILADVELVSFNATPDHIGPFGASRLAWEVNGPNSGFHVTLNGGTVARAGHEIVQPQSTTSYHLNAVAVGATKFLRAITVQVNESACENNSLFNPQVTITGFLNTQVQGKKDIYFNGDTEVIFSPGTIQFKLHLGKRIRHFPDADVEIDASLGLAVVQGHIVSIVQNISADVSVPFYAWFIPGALPGLAIALSMGTDDARKSARDLIAGLGPFIDFLGSFSNPNLIKHSVRIGVDGDGHGTIDVQACPNDLLLKFVKISSASAIG